MRAVRCRSFGAIGASRSGGIDDFVVAVAKNASRAAGFGVSVGGTGGAGFTVDAVSVCRAYRTRRSAAGNGVSVHTAQAGYRAVDIRTAGFAIRDVSIASRQNAFVRHIRIIGRLLRKARFASRAGYSDVVYADIRSGASGAVRHFDRTRRAIVFVDIRSRRTGRRFAPVFSGRGVVLHVITVIASGAV